MIPTTDIVAKGTPAGWRTMPFWSLFRRQKSTGFPDEELLSVYRDYGVVPKSSRDDNHNKASEDLSGYQLVTEGALVTNKMKAWQGSIAISRYRGIVSPAYYVYTPQSNECDQYLHYLLRSDPYIGLYGRISKGVRVNQWDLEHEALRNIPVLLPDLATQRQIADFLDRETARIDLLIEKKQRLVALLGEKKEAELSNLDQALFADTRKLSRLSYHVTKVGSGKTPSGGATIYQETGVLFLRSQNIKNDGVSLEDAAYISDEINAGMANSRVQPRDILLNITGASLGRCAIAPADLPAANVNQHVCIIRPMKHLLPEYLHTLLIAPRMQGVIRAEAFSAGREGLNFESIRNFRIPVPDTLEAQRAVASRIQTISERDFRILSANAKSIDRLKEYRSALITAAVTGQIDVQTYARSGTTDRHLDAIQEEMAP